MYVYISIYIYEGIYMEIFMCVCMYRIIKDLIFLKVKVLNLSV